jgi:hypothetical protein
VQSRRLAKGDIPCFSLICIAKEPEEYRKRRCHYIRSDTQRMLSDFRREPLWKDSVMAAWVSPSIAENTRLHRLLPSNSCPTLFLVLSSFQSGGDSDVVRRPQSTWRAIGLIPSKEVRRLYAQVATDEDQINPLGYQR